MDNIRNYLLLVVLCVLFSSQAQVSRKVTTTKIGELESLLGGDATKIESLTVDGPMNIEDLAFLRSLTITARLADINIKNADVEGDSLPESVFANDIYKPSSVLRKVVLPDKVKKIGEFTFIYCRKLEEVVLPDGLKSIPTSCFYGCDKLKSINMPSSLDTICSHALRSCIMKEMTIPEGVTVIENFALGSYETLVLPSTLKQVGLCSIAATAITKSITLKTPYPPEYIVYPEYHPKPYQPGNKFYGPFTEETYERHAVIVIYIPKGSYQNYANDIFWRKFDYIEYDDTTTGIENINVNGEIDDNIIYNLMGQRVDKPSRNHIYIRNGKKFIYRGA